MFRRGGSRTVLKPPSFRKLETELMNKTIVVKLGGSTLGGQSGTASPDTTLQDLLRLTAEGVRVVVVHGGGNATSDLLKRLGQEPRFLNGLRITDAAALQAATMMIRGQINSDLVQSFNQASLAAATESHKATLALGMSGLDGNMLEARRETRHGDLGFVGEVVKVRVEPLAMALEWGFVPFVAPLGFAVDAEAQTYNLNADTAAAAIAAALEADACVFLTDVPGVLDGDKKTIRRLGLKSIPKLIADEVITGGMIPKVTAAAKALEGAKRVMILDGRQPNALYDAVQNYLPNGTTFVRRLEMQIKLTEPLPQNPNFAYRTDTLPKDLDILTPLFQAGYYGTIDYDWGDEAEGRALLTTDLSPEWGVFMDDYSIAAWDGDKLIGLITIVQEDSEPHLQCITNVCTLPEYRGRGVGRAMLTTALNRVLAAGFEGAKLFVTIGNDSAWRLYKSLGFVDVKTFDV